MSIATAITRLQDVKADLKEAINNKGGSLTDESIEEYASAVDALETGGGKLPIMTGKDLFSKSSKVIDPQMLDTSDCTSFASMFYNNRVTTRDCSGWSTSKVTSMTYMFANNGLQSINIDGWDFSAVTTLSYMFSGNTSLTVITGEISNLGQNMTNVNMTLTAALTRDSLLSLLNGLVEKTDGATHNFVLGSRVAYNNLTDEDKAIVTNKGWTITIS